MTRLRLAVAGALVGLAVAGCAGADPAAPVAAPISAPSAPSTPAAGAPSPSATMICEDEARGDIDEALGIPVDRIEQPTWADQLYTCRYVYPSGSFVVSVKELGSPDATTAYMGELATRLGTDRLLDGLGEGAFVTTNGSVVVRKDLKVLLVDDTGLPPQLGSPPVDPPEAALVVAKTIMGCWTGV
jgi:hypothetical protein